MKTLALLVLSIATLTTGCAGMGTKRPSGGAQIQKTSSDTATNPIENDHDSTFERADLGQR